MEKKVKNMRQNRITFIVFGVLFCLIGLFFWPFIIFGAILILLGIKTHITYKEDVRQPETDPAAPDTEPERDTVRVIDVDGSEHELSTYLALDDPDMVLVTDGGKTYHTSLGCFKRWSPEYQENFKGWTIISKEEAEKRGLKYCSFCEESSSYKLDDIEDVDWDNL